jgi:alpha-glucosidase
MWHMIKDAKLRDEPVNVDYQPYMATYEQLLHVYSTDQPEVHDIVRKMRRVLNEYKERMMIGEVYLPVHKLIGYYGVNNTGAHLPFNFQLVSLPWDARQIAAAVDEYEGALPAQSWPNWVLGNHDQPRITSRIGLQQARVAAMLLLTLRGTPTLYYGDEIGMQDVAIPFEEVQDPQGLNMPDKNLSRDPARTPMQWDSSDNAGFTTGKPWLRLHRSYRRRNVATEKEDRYSMLCLYKRLIELRQKEPSLMTGTYTPVYADQHAMAYIRQTDDTNKYLMVLNLSNGPCYFTPKNFSFTGKVVLATAPELEGLTFTDTLALGGAEAVIMKIK